MFHTIFKIPTFELIDGSYVVFTQKPNSTEIPEKPSTASIYTPSSPQFYL